ncbi:hypothetical protein ES703_124149 [subsurface metagenome]
MDDIWITDQGQQQGDLLLPAIELVVGIVGHAFEMHRDITDQVFQLLSLLIPRLIQWEIALTEQPAESESSAIAVLLHDFPLIFGKILTHQLQERLDILALLQEVNERANGRWPNYEALGQDGKGHRLLINRLG